MQSRVWRQKRFLLRLAAVDAPARRAAFVGIVASGDLAAPAARLAAVFRLSADEGRRLWGGGEGGGGSGGDDDGGDVGSGGILGVLGAAVGATTVGVAGARGGGGGDNVGLAAVSGIVGATEMSKRRSRCRRRRKGGEGSTWLDAGVMVVGGGAIALCCSSVPLATMAVDDEGIALSAKVSETLGRGRSAAAADTAAAMEADRATSVLALTGVLGNAPSLRASGLA
eukprot:jgi/Undpi1/1607/HiC_scaffold_11.g04997.m1